MEQSYFDNSFYTTQIPDMIPYGLQLQPAFQLPYDDSFGMTSSITDFTSDDLESNQEFLNLMFLQNQLVQTQQFEFEPLLITPTEDMFPQLEIINVEDKFWSQDDESLERYSTPSPDFSFEPKTPFMMIPNMQQSTLMKTRILLRPQKSLNEIASRSSSMGSLPKSSIDLHSPTYLNKELLPQRDEIRKPKRLGSNSSKGPLRIHNTFIREYDNKKVLKFIKGTKKTNRGYKNFINYKCTGDNFERDT